MSLKDAIIAREALSLLVTCLQLRSQQLSKKRPHQVSCVCWMLPMLLLNVLFLQSKDLTCITSLYQYSFSVTQVCLQDCKNVRSNTDQIKVQRKFRNVLFGYLSYCQK